MKFLTLSFLFIFCCISFESIAASSQPDAKRARLLANRESSPQTHIDQAKEEHDMIKKLSSDGLESLQAIEYIESRPHLIMKLIQIMTTDKLRFRQDISSALFLILQRKPIIGAFLIKPNILCNQPLVSHIKENDEILYQALSISHEL